MPTPAATGCSNRCASSGGPSCATRNGLPSPSATRPGISISPNGPPVRWEGPTSPRPPARLDREFGNLRVDVLVLRRTRRRRAMRPARRGAARVLVPFDARRGDRVGRGGDHDARVRRLAACAAGARHRCVRSVRPWRPRPLHRVRRHGGGDVAASRRRARQASPSGRSATRGSIAAKPRSPSSGWTGCSTTPAPAPTPG